MKTKNVTRLEFLNNAAWLHNAGFEVIARLSWAVIFYTDTGIPRLVKTFEAGEAGGGELIAWLQERESGKTAATLADMRKEWHDSYTAMITEEARAVAA